MPNPGKFREGESLLAREGKTDVAEEVFRKMTEMVRKIVVDKNKNMTRNMKTEHGRQSK